MPVTGGVTVALLATGAENQAAAVDELDRSQSVRYCETSDALLKLVAAGGVDVAVTELRDRHNESVSPAIATLHERAPGVPVVTYFAPSPATLQEVPAALTAGASECAIRGYDRLGGVVRRVLAPQWRPGAGLPLLEMLRPLLPTDLEEFGIACALKASPRLTPERLASWIRVRERTLRSRLQRADLAAPGTFIDYGAAVHAACMLDLHGFKVEAVVETMQFGSTRALNALLRQYTGKSAKELREHGGFSVLLLQAEQVLRRPGLLENLSIGIDARLIDRYLAGELSGDQQMEFEQWLVSAPPAVAEMLEQMRRLLGPRPSPAVLRRRKREIWARLWRKLRGR
jgi:hypothetical protein